MKNLRFILISLILIAISGFIRKYLQKYPVCTDRTRQYLPASVKSSINNIEDGFLVCWLDDRNEGSLYVQKLDIHGKIQWTQNGIMLDSQLGGGFTSDKDYPLIFSDNSGGAVIIYRKTFFSSEEIFVQKIYPDGTHLQRPVCLSSYYDGFNYSTNAALTKDNCIVVAWENFSNGDFNIHSQKINFDGAKLWNDGMEVLVCDFLFDQRRVNVAVDASNYAIYTWLDDRNSINHSEFEFDLYGNSLDGDGNYTDYNSKGKLIFNNNRNSETDGNASSNIAEKINFYNHNITSSDKNSFIIAFEKYFKDNDSFIKILKVDKNLDIEWESDFDADSSQYNPLIISDGEQGACVFWNDGRNDENSIFGTRVQNTGKEQWGNNNGIKISFDDMKYSSKRILPSEKNRNGICIEGGKIYLSWAAQGVNKLFLSVLNLANDHGKCDNAIEIQNDVSEGEYTSLIVLNNKIVVVYLQSGNIFASINSIEGFREERKITKPVIMNNFPNPFNPSTTINFKISKDGNVKLGVYDITGREVRILLNEFKYKGEYNEVFDARELSSGVYFYRIESNGFSVTNRMTLIK